jgi:hypothetical protein
MGKFVCEDAPKRSMRWPIRPFWSLPNGLSDHGLLQFGRMLPSPLNFVSRSTGWRFQQDGASVHRAMTTQAYLARSRVRLLNNGFWPPMSPALNPIEHVWPMVLHRMKGSIFSGREDLWTALQEHFAAITPAQIKALYDSMPDRVGQVLAQRGGPTRY